MVSAIAMHSLAFFSYPSGDVCSTLHPDTTLSGAQTKWADAGSPGKVRPGLSAHLPRKRATSAGNPQFPCAHRRQADGGLLWATDEMAEDSQRDVLAEARAGRTVRAAAGGLIRVIPTQGLILSDILSDVSRT